MEIEAKYAVPNAETLALLSALPALDRYRLESGEARTDEDTFLDTADRRLLAAGYYLRRRETGTGVRMTLKGLVAQENDGVFRREELEALVAVDVPPAEWPPGDLRDRVCDIIAEVPLETLLHLHQDRVARRVLDDDREVAELSLDTVHTGDGSEWYEVEVEIRGDGDEDDLARLIAALTTQAELTPETRAKFSRALDAISRGHEELPARLLPSVERKRHEELAQAGGRRARRAIALLALDEGATQVEAGLRAGLSDRQVRYWLARYRNEGVAIYGRAAKVTPDVAAAIATVKRSAPPVKAPTPTPEAKPPAGDGSKKRPNIDPSDSMTVAAASTLRFHLERMLEHEAGTRLGEDIEELHDMRVSTRRMRMALRVFADYLDPETLRPVLKGLRRTGRTLGAVRDLDVFYEKTKRYLDGVPAARADDLDGLLAAWKSERDLRRQELVAYLDGSRYRRFVDMTLELLEGPVERMAPSLASVDRPQRVARVLPGLLYQDMAAVWSYEGQIDGLDTPLLTFHALRKACKGLRYTLEFFEGVLGSESRSLIKRVKGLQDHLGDLQDAVVTCGILRDYITWGEWRHHGHTLPEPTELIVAPGAARYLAARQEEMERLVLGFPEAWPKVAGAGFSRDLARVIAEI
ncbi:MAG: CHAD domain-containing protein [Thermoleophilia bacterium]